MNWKSTLLGAALAASDILLQLPSVDLSDWKVWIRPALIAAFGYVVADAKKAYKP